MPDMLGVCQWLEQTPFGSEDSRFLLAIPSHRDSSSIRHRGAGWSHIDAGSAPIGAGHETRAGVQDCASDVGMDLGGVRCHGLHGLSYVCVGSDALLGEYGVPLQDGDAPFGGAERADFPHDQLQTVGEMGYLGAHSARSQGCRRFLGSALVWHCRGWAVDCVRLKGGRFPVAVLPGMTRFPVRIWCPRKRLKAVRRRNT